MRRLVHSVDKGKVLWGVSMRVVAVVVAAAWMTYTGCAASSAQPVNEGAPVLGQHSVAIYGLSRGKGVPEAARLVLQDVRGLAETGKQRGTVQEWRQTRIGLEGETRVCVDLRDESAKQDFLRQIREMVQGIDLINVVEEPCLQR
jgi:hypothetical protein